MRDFPDARNSERDRLLGYVTLRPGQVVVDVQAAGGYLADEVHRRLNGSVRIVCVEPSVEHHRRLDPAYEIVSDPIEHFPSIGDGQADVVLGLIALHHSRSHAATIGECHRVLKPGGEMAVCDVLAGTRLAAWLNDFVATHCPAGHDGNFPVAGEIRRLCTDAGFADVIEEVSDVPWRFERRADIAVFFKGLFGLAADIALIDRAIDHYFDVAVTPHGCSVGWQLAYAHARKRG